MMVAYENDEVVLAIDDTEAFDVVLSHALFHMGFGGIPRWSGMFMLELGCFGAARLAGAGVPINQSHRDKAERAIGAILEAGADHIKQPDTWKRKFDGSTLEVRVPPLDAMRMMIDFTRLSAVADLAGEPRTFAWTDRTYTNFLNAVPKDVILEAVGKMNITPETLAKASKALDRDITFRKQQGRGLPN